MICKTNPIIEIPTQLPLDDSEGLREDLSKPLHERRHPDAMAVSEADQKRFWAKVNKSEPERCWEWTAYKHRQGYGIFRIGKRLHYAHRIAFHITYGELPKASECCHACDNARCVNPRHLFAATHQENMRDKVKKGRAYVGCHQGELCASSKLTSNQIKEIRKLLELSSYSQKEIGLKFGVLQQTISKIKRRLRWSHIP